MKEGFLALASTVVLMLVVIACAAFAGCSQHIPNDTALSPDPALVGRWVLETESNLIVAPDIPFYVDYLKDGTGIEYGPSGAGRGWIWKTENSRLYLFCADADANARVWYYTISDSTFTLTNDDGQTETFKRR